MTPRTPGSLRTPPICKMRAAHFLANQPASSPASRGRTQGSHLGGLTGEPGHSILITHKHTAPAMSSVIRAPNNQSQSLALPRAGEDAKLTRTRPLPGRSSESVKLMSWSRLAALPSDVHPREGSLPSTPSPWTRGRLGQVHLNQPRSGSTRDATQGGRAAGEGIGCIYPERN